MQRNRLSPSSYMIFWDYLLLSRKKTTSLVVCSNSLKQYLHSVPKQRRVGFLFAKKRSDSQYSHLILVLAKYMYNNYCMNIHSLFSSRVPLSHCRGRGCSEMTYSTETCAHNLCLQINFSVQHSCQWPCRIPQTWEIMEKWVGLSDIYLHYSIWPSHLGTFTAANVSYYVASHREISLHSSFSTFTCLKG